MSSRTRPSGPAPFLPIASRAYNTAADSPRWSTTGDGRPFAAHAAAGAAVAHDWNCPGSSDANRGPRHELPADSNTTAFDIDAPRAGLAVLGESWLDGDFRATIDGRPVPYFRVNHAFRGVWIGNVRPAPGRIFLLAAAAHRGARRCLGRALLLGSALLFAFRPFGKISAGAKPRNRSRSTRPQPTGESALP